MFSLNKKKIFKIKQEEKEYAIAGIDSLGPVFGKNCNIMIYNNCNVDNNSYTYNNGKYYEGDPLNPYEMSGDCNFNVKEIEVYQVSYQW